MKVRFWGCNINAKSWSRRTKYFNKLGPHRAPKVPTKVIIFSLCVFSHVCKLVSYPVWKLFHAQKLFTNLFHIQKFLQTNDLISCFLEQLVTYQHNMGRVLSTNSRGRLCDTQNTDPNTMLTRKHQQLSCSKNSKLQANNAN